eukprot:1137150-Pelagomonas_calceolata.AAC.4
MKGNHQQLESLRSAGAFGGCHCAGRLVAKSVALLILRLQRRYAGEQEVTPNALVQLYRKPCSI